jgi:valyl-tRNA synthetase
MEGAIDVEAEKDKLKTELVYLQGFLKLVEKKLSNEKFVNNAPEKVVAIEKQKKADALAKLETIEASLKVL